MSLFAHKDVPVSALSWECGAVPAGSVSILAVLRPGLWCLWSHTGHSVLIAPSHREDVFSPALTQYRAPSITLWDFFRPREDQKIFCIIQARQYQWPCSPRPPATASLHASQTLPGFLSEPPPSSEMWREDHWGLVAARLCQKNGYQVCQHHNQSCVIFWIRNYCVTIFRFGEWRSDNVQISRVDIHELNTVSANNTELQLQLQIAKYGV